ncbi:MAG TPA: class I SAM-dependent methyltransferase [Acidimicrobiales bacterium]|nr:class I SAM-dependent methyltransferase [Acidimicrobiales bacterium]
MDRNDWDARYAGDELLWSAEPNRFLVEEVSDLPPGRVLDVACGEGRNAIWLASRGWRATGVDFSEVGLAKADRLGRRSGVDVDWVVADLMEWAPDSEAFDLVIIFYLQLPADRRRKVYRNMAAGLAPGGTILVVGHDSDNLARGYGGPQDPSVLFSTNDVAGDLAGLEIVKAQQVLRTVKTDEGEKTAIDALVRAVRR